jgi:hypothetical protein
MKQSTPSLKAGQHWQQVLAILTGCNENSYSEVSEFTHPLTSLEVTRRIQIVRDHLMAIPRRRLSGLRRYRTNEGKTNIPAETIL